MLTEVGTRRYRLATIVPTVYSIIVYRRQLKYEEYNPTAANAKSYGYNTPPTAGTPSEECRLELGEEIHSDGSDTSSQAANLGGVPSHSRSVSKSVASIKSSRRSVALSTKGIDRRVSNGSSMVSIFDTSESAAALEVNKNRAAAAAAAIAAGPRETYTHERSTEFEDYLKRRSTNGGTTSPLDVLSPVGSRCVSWASSRGLLAVPEGVEVTSSLAGGGNGSGIGSFNTVYSPYVPYSTNGVGKRYSGGSLVSPVSPPNSPPRVGSGPGQVSPPSSNPYEDTRRRADNETLDRRGSLVNSRDLGNQSLPRRS
jgi:hypothetical protein